MGNELTHIDLTMVAYQIAKGMDFLASKKVFDFFLFSTAKCRVFYLNKLYKPLKLLKVVCGGSISVR